MSYANGLNVQATPTRGSDRHAFPASAQPSPAPSLRQTASSSASASFTHLPSASTSTSSGPVVQVSQQTITLEGLLKQHASSPDPTRAALEQVVADRNVLSSQNIQLWKLIEKQRTGYNQILKELERIRSERDSYKAKLVALNAVPNGSSDKRQKTPNERSSRPSLDTVSSFSSTNQHASQNRGNMPRHSSDDMVTPRSSHQPQPPQQSRSYDPMSSRPNDTSSLSNPVQPAIIASVRTSSPPPGPPLPAPVTPSTRTSSRPSPSPLVVPNRVDTLSAYTISDSPDSSTSSKPPTGSEPNNMTNNPNGNGIYAPPAPRPLPHPRKSSLADSVSSVLTTGSSVISSGSTINSVSSSASSQNYGANQPTPSQPYQPGFTPATAPANFNNPFNSSSESLLARQRGISPAASSPAIISPPGAATSSHLANGSAPSQAPQPNMLVVDPRPYFMSRDSRISLPDEASRYIQNMADSPAASPRVEAFATKSKLSNAVYPPPSNETKPGRESEFLDMEEEEEEESEQDSPTERPENMSVGAGKPSFDSFQSQAQAGVQDNNTNNTNTTHLGYASFQADITNNYSSQYMPRDESDAVQGRRREKSRVGAEEFPLPPPSTMYPPPRQQSLTNQEPTTLPYAQGVPSQQQQQSGQFLQALPSPPPAPAPSPSKHAQAMADQHHNSSSQRPGEGSHPSMQETAYPSQQPPPRSESIPQQQQPQEQQPQPSDALPTQAVPASFRALPLLSSDLPHTTINVSHSFVRPNDRGKEVLSFVVYVNPGNGKDGWKVEKMYSDVLSLDQRVRNSVGKGVGKKIANLPEGKLWKDHAPAKVDQRKAVLENYLQTLIQLPVKNNDEVIAFFTSDIVRDEKQPVMQAGHKEGYLTKRGKNFGGWKTRFFVLQGPVLEYYDCRGGAHLGSIVITGAQIARQHRTERPPSDDEKEYRHAFLILESKKGPGGSHPRHVLCAESDEDRDSWVEMLVRYYTGVYSEDLVFNPTSGLTSVQSNSSAAASQQSLGQSRSSMSSNDISSQSTPRSKPIPVGGSARSLVPGSASDLSNGKMFPSGMASDDYLRSSSPSRSVDPSPIDRQGPSAAGGMGMRNLVDRNGSNLGLPSSLPDSSPLSSGPFAPADGGVGQVSVPMQPQRANSELGHYPDMAADGSRLGQALTPNRNHRQHSPERHRPRDDGRKSFYPMLNTVGASPTTAVPPQPDRVPSPEKLDASGKVKISGPMNGAPIPSGFKFGGKEVPSTEPSAAANDRREKAKSRSFWGFGKVTGDKSHLQVAYPPRAVFGVPLEDALDVAQICNLPAIVFRSIQYLEAKKADQEEGIYRLSGSSAVIKNLKDMFNSEGDVDLLASDEYWDPHAIAGLLKSFLRELPSSILTRDLHLKFLAVIDFVDAQERIRELSQLISALPLANYTLLRALTAHLILIVQNSNVNKMTMRNVGIVFSPTLGIPAGVFSLMLGEFNRVFNVDADNDELGPKEGNGALENPSEEPLRRNSRQYSDAAADQVLGLAGRSLSASAEEAQSDGDDFSIQDESGTETTEGELTVDSSSSSSPASTQVQQQRDFGGVRITEPDPPNTPTAKAASKAAAAAASRGLNVAVTHSDRGNRHSRMIGLPASPRPTYSPSRSDMPGNGSDSNMS
ncbi:hypothetical protein BDN70DRAFT_880139 [Pholiota conissans]|uniref:RhoGAP-domain-containing protein n=1 Tax=Pholiota conissans TaxID=109636 RepID=A0A9P5Z054_9AGAR|nr:hypothetical protein BDN70DRAFT_880139 [Pholiota conissans]